MKRSTLLTGLGAGVSAPFVRPVRSSAQSLIPVRLAVIASAGQYEVPSAVQKYGLDKKYGFSLQVSDIARPGGQWTMMRADAIDIASGNFIDVLRQRKAGIGVQAFHGYQGYSNIIMTKSQSPIKTFADLKGKRFGEFGTAFLDWLIIRAAGKKAYDVDLEKDATLVQGAPPLLNEFLARDQADAVLQYPTLTFGPIITGQQRAVISVADLMKAAGFNPNCFYLDWAISEKWTATNTGAVVRLSAMLEDAYDKLRTDDSLWPPLAEKVGITEPASIAAYRNEARRLDDPPYAASLITPSQRLLDAIIAITGPDAVGVTQVDPQAFLFPGHTRR